MALDFGDGRGGHGLFDPIPPSSSDSSKKKAGNIDDENENSKEWKEDELDSQKGNEEEEDEDDFEDWPTAPPLDILDCIKGYEMVSFDATSVPPPPFEQVEEEEVGKKPENEEDKKDENGEDGKQDGGDIKAKVRLYSFAQQTDLHSIPEKKKRKDRFWSRLGTQI